MKFPHASQVLLCPASPDTIFAGAYTLILALQIKIFDVACIVFQPKIWLLKNIKFDVRIGTWMSSSIHLRCWLMRVKDFWAPFILVSSSWWLRAELRLSCHLMWCFAKNSWIFYFFKILYSHFEAPRNVEKLSELIFAGLPLQTINLYRLVSYSSRP